LVPIFFNKKLFIFFLCYLCRLRFWEIWIPGILNLKRPNLSSRCFFFLSLSYLVRKNKLWTARLLISSYATCNSPVILLDLKLLINYVTIQAIWLKCSFFPNRTDYFEEKSVNVKALKKCLISSVGTFVPVAFFTAQWTLFLALRQSSLRDYFEPPRYCCLLIWTL